MARPTKLTPEVAERLVHAISVGASYKAACRYAGISYQTFLNWRKCVRKGASRGDGSPSRETDEGNEQFVELFDHINKVEGESIQEQIAAQEERNEGLYEGWEQEYDDELYDDIAC